LFGEESGAGVVFVGDQGTRSYLDLNHSGAGGCAQFLDSGAELGEGGAVITGCLRVER
jgi:hypothetical protein